MTAALAIAVLLLALVLVFSTILETLYLESLRLRAREAPALEFFRKELEEKIGREGDAGVLSFAVIKHTTLVLLGVAYFGIALAGTQGFSEALLEACVLSWLTMLVSAYLLPNWLYRRSSCHWLLPLVPLARGMAFVVSPLTGLLGFLQSITELGANGGEPEEESTAQENIEALISAGAEEGLIEEDDKKLIQSVVEFGDKTLRDVMTPRPSIVAIPVERSLEDLRQLVIHEQYSRIPVYEGTIDRIIGFVHVRDLFELSNEERATKRIRDLVRNVGCYPETKPVNGMLDEMRSNGTHMAVVVDEYGHTAGLVTMEDMVEEIVGEIRDEHEPGADVTQDEKGYVVSGSFDLDGLDDLLHFRPEEEMESTTVAGLVTEWAGRVPRIGEVIEREGLRIEVLAGNDLRVERVRVSRAEQ